MVGFFTHQVAVVTVFQHALGVATALLLYVGVRRLTGSPWPGLLPAAVLLLNSDQILLEQSILSEPLFSFLLAGALYCAVRAFESSDPWWRWPIAAGALTALAAVVRTEGVFLVPVLCLALFLAHRRPWRARLVAPGAVVASAAAILLAYGLANDVSNGRFEVGPSVGWHLYGRVAPFADCSQFTPPKGTEPLCHANPPGGRAGSDWYIFLPEAPAVRTFGHIGEEDEKLKAFALQVIEHQPLAYLREVFRDVRTYFAPDTRHNPPAYAGPDLNELDWGPLVDPVTLGQIKRGMESFFDPFTAHESPGGTRFLLDYEHPFRFGATLLTLCSLLTALGLLIGGRRPRIGVLLYGVGGLSVLVLSMFGGWYVGRHTVPISGPLAAGASIALFSLWQLERGRRRAARTAATPG
jgi:4-amino-4-deoxy-L-arabinose transferase-like glycosyltransferase